MEIEIALNKNDLKTLVQYQVKHSRQMEQRSKRLRWGYAIGLFLLALGIYLISQDMFTAALLGILAILSAIFYPFIHQKRIQRYIDRVVESRSKPEIFANRLFCITSEGLEEKSEYAQSKVQWHLVDGVDVTLDNTFISIQGVYSVIIPKASVRNGNYEEFVEVVQGYVDNKMNL
jgi:hypothetical protein